ncbi:MAG TPA: PDR/VanB family oxidoreductase [Actinospica sp.]|nr:PDR/VanB family oxidoreductase [Actinospica sp.]
MTEHRRATEGRGPASRADGSRLAAFSSVATQTQGASLLGLARLGPRPAPSPGPRPSVALQAVVGARTEAADGVVALTLVPADGGPLPEWTPGAHIDLQLTETLTRQYSLCGDPADRDAWRIAVLREPAGRGGSAYVHDSLAVDSTVPISAPRNNFQLQPAPRYLFIAGGIGITPLLPMIAEAEAAGADWTLLYGGRTRASMAFTDELARYGEKVRFRPQDEHGLLDLADYLGLVQHGALIYACGPEPMLKAVASACDHWPPTALHVERFAPIELAEPVRGDSFEVVLARSGKTVTVGPDRSILEALEIEGVNVLSSCREGTCGTCETDVLEGEPEHRDSLLTPAERAANETMFICVSRCLGAQLTLDL